MKILITSGGTEEPIDGVRSISNISTGQTGAVLAGVLASKGAQIKLIRSWRAAVPPKGMEEELFQSYTDLSAALKHNLKNKHWDAVIHLAAVSDYSVTSVDVGGKPFPPGGPGKIEAGQDIRIMLKPTAKILDSLGIWSRNPNITVVGFKLTDGGTPEEKAEKVREIFMRGGADIVVHNDRQTIEKLIHPASIWTKDGIWRTTKTKDEMARVLYALLIEEHTCI